MTLIIYVRCQDASIIISDRLESGRGSQDVKKYYVSNNGDYILGLAGPSDPTITLLRYIKQDTTINSANIVDKIEEIVTRNHRIFLNNDPQEGFLLLNNGTTFNFNSVDIKPPSPIIGPIDVQYRCFGDPEAKGIANNFLSKRNLVQVNSEYACQYLIAIMLEANNAVSTVGGINRGFDILVLSNTGKIIDNPHAKLTLSESIKKQIEQTLFT